MIRTVFLVMIFVNAIFNLDMTTVITRDLTIRLGKHTEKGG